MDWDEIKWGNTVMRELAEKAIVAELHIPVGYAAKYYKKNTEQGGAGQRR
jgi:hypothetical protein